jgi:quinol monooxygenase YgiN
VIVEYVRYQIPPDRDAAFRSAYGRAVASLQASPHCLGYELARCEEDRGAYVLRIHWTSTADHMQGFRRSAEFGPFLAEVRPFVELIQEMRHYEQTELVWSRVA